MTAGHRNPPITGPWWRLRPDGRHDADGVTVRLVRRSDGLAYAVAIRVAQPWVLRRRWLIEEDL